MMLNVRAAMKILKRPPQRCCCLTCAHFCNDPKTMEEEIPGLQVMGSGWASVRKEDGLCRLRDVYLDATSCCTDYTPRRRQAR